MTPTRFETCRNSRLSGLPGRLTLRLPKPGRRTFLPAFLCAFLLAAGGADARAQEPPSATAGVVTALKTGDSQRALTLTKDALQHAPHDCRLLSLQAIAHTGLHQQQLALASFHKALSFCPSYLPALEGAAQITFAHDPDKAIPLLERILTLQSENPTAHAMLATTLRAQERCPEALRHYAASAVLFPSRPDLLQAYGSCLAQTGDLKAALAQYVALLTSSPKDAIRYDVALLQWKTHANDDALATLAPLLSTSPEEHALALASKLHEEQGDTPGAVSLLRQAILAAPDDVDNYLDFAAIAFNHKSFQVGIDMLDAGVDRLPGAAPLYVARGVLEVQLAKGDVAITDFEQAHRLDPKLSFAVDAVGIMQSQQHQDGRSLAIFETEANRHPDDPLLQYLLAEQLSQRSDEQNASNLQSAIVAARRATTLDPHYQAAHDLLARLYVQTKQPGLAIQQAELALAEDPNDQVALYQEMMARRATGNKEEIQALVARFNEARRLNDKKQQNVDRYRLQDQLSH